MTKPLKDALSRRIFRGIIALYPADFRHRFGPELLQLFDDISIDASGSPPLSRLTITTTALVNTAGALLPNNSTDFYD